MLEPIVARTATGAAHHLTGSRAFYDEKPVRGRRVYFGNHTSNGDFVMIWAALPGELRHHVRPVAAADYWNAGPLRRYLIHRVFRGVLIEREPAKRTRDPVTQMAEAIESGHSLILFPEGTRSTSGEVLPFKTGLYHLAETCEALDMVPVWLENLNRVMPKGRVIPLPLLCTARFGTPLQLRAGEDKHAFLDRARTALLQLAPEDH